MAEDQSKCAGLPPASSSKISLRAESVALALAAVLGLGVVATPSAQAQTYKETVLYSFTGTPDGANPWTGLIRDKAGNLYGTTHDGGGPGQGTVFKLTAKGKEIVLYSFQGYPDAAHPQAGLVRDAAGDLFGTTTYYGGAFLWGAVFKVTKARKEAVLYSFTGGADGGYPTGGVVRDAAGNLYGTTVDGGEGSGCYYGGCGTAFKLDASGKETVLYSFTVGSDGESPAAGLVRDSVDNVYGTTFYGGNAACNKGGNSGCGTVFTVTKSGDETVLYAFSGGTDGAYPYAGLLRDAKGNLYGTTSEGGDLKCAPPYGCGTVFKLTKAGKLTVLHRFTGGVDGAGPNGGLIRDPAGNLYGASGGGNGRVFKLTKARKLTVLYRFTGGVDGAGPNGGLIRDAEGNLYGTTIGGGDLNCNLNGIVGCGVVFKLVEGG
jgi:uncharacterized repeat protein (TIGR03803 family)